MLDKTTANHSIGLTLSGQELMGAHLEFSAGKVIIQTAEPDNEIIRQVVHTDYNQFFNTQFNERKQYKYPPFYRLINLTLKHKNKETLNKAAWLFANALRQYFGTRVLGPEAPVVGRVQNWHIKQVMLKLEKTQEIKAHKQKINELMVTVKTQPGFSSLQIHADVDFF